MHKNFIKPNIYTALITPFKDNQIDEQSFINLVQNQIKAKVAAIIISGTTGEAATLSAEEIIKLIKLSKSVLTPEVKLIVGTGNNNTSSTIDLSVKAQEAGADGLIIVTPYYNRPSQKGLYHHYKAINDAVNIPIMLYSAPKRTGIDFSDETIIELSKLDNIIALKDSADDLTRPTRLNNQIRGEFYFISGDDENFLTYTRNGGVGCVSVSANIIPEQMVLLANYINNNQDSEALAIQDRLAIFYKALFCETNPTPVKYGASLLKLCNPDVRLPLVIPEQISCQQIENALRSLELLNK